MFETRYKSHHDAEAAYGKTTKPTPATKQILEEYLHATPAPKGRHVIYIHVPFCDKICSFCNLNRQILKGTTEDYTEKLIKQIEYYGKYPYTANMQIGSVYFGGGTPTVLPGESFIRILDALRSNFNLAEDCEITSESTLHNLTPEKLKQMDAAGINRISVGIQTFHSEGRKFFNRTGDKNYAVEGIKMVQRHFPHTLAIDKIYNYPGETLESLLDDVATIKQLGITSVSFYSLMIHKGSALSHTMDENMLAENSDLLFHNAFVNAMTDKSDYYILELTKIAKGNADEYAYIALRNSGANTLPLGEGAGGNLGPYGLYQMSFERLMVAAYSEQKQKADALYGLMQKGHFTTSEIATITGNSNWAEALTQQYCDEELLLENKDGYQLTPNGLFYGNNICASYVLEYLDSVSTNQASHCMNKTKG